MSAEQLNQEGERIMTICNACRYCEGFCAVFPAMEKRLTFTAADMSYLANLCHGCGECLRSCQYEPPHPFDVNVPRTLANIRLQSYEQYCWPQPLAAAFRSNALATVLGIAGTLAVGMALAVAIINHHALIGASDHANFYAVLSHRVMATVFSAVFVFVIAACAIAVGRYLKDTGSQFDHAESGGSVIAGLRDAFSLKYMHGSGADCTTDENSRTPWRRWFHHFTFYGFLSCFASTAVATIYDVIDGWPAPYPLLSLPVMLGVIGGVGLTVGPIGLWIIRRRIDPATLDPGEAGLSRAFILTLLLTSVSGLALLAFRDTMEMTLLLIAHLAAVMTLFATLPYGKFVHGLYRAAALIQYVRESRSAAKTTADAAG
ncbi:MAG TPA: tricarballylate utilization 4Fe-4S protein TcuB [Steroidobacteraceae bacterium]